MFAELGVPVYFADDEAKALMNGSKEIRSKIIELLGEQAYSDTRLNREYVASRVFMDSKLLQALNAIVHPEVERHFAGWVQTQNSPYVIQENPLLFEKGRLKDYYAVIVVTAPLDLRIERVMARDGISREQVLARVRNQMDDAIKVEKATFVINNTDLHACRERVMAIHRELLA